MVLAGTKEKDAISTIFSNLPSRAIIITHNAPFDRDTLLKTNIHWKNKHKDMVEFIFNITMQS